MTSPGVTVGQSSTLPPQSVPADTSTWFVAGIAQRGQIAPIQITSLGEFIDKLGVRQSNSPLYDAAETFFREGGGRMVVSRVVGPAAVIATHTFLDGSSGQSLIIKANSPGAWGNNLQVAIVAGAVSGYQVRVKYNGNVVEQSGDLTTQADAVAWASSSHYVTITVGSGTLPPAVVADTSLTTGADDLGSVTDTHWLNALNQFSKDLGPGLVTQVGRTTSQAHLDTLLHASQNNRAAVLDGPDTPTAATLISLAALDTAGGNGHYGAMFAPWVVVPGITPGTVRTVPPSAFVAGIIGRNEGFLSANAPSAGANGIGRYAIGLSQVDWTDVDRSSLNGGGVDAIRILRQQVVIYGWRSLANPNSEPDWLNFGNARLYTAIAADAEVIAAAYVLNQIDGQGLLISQFGADLVSMLLTYWNQGALYGSTPDEAFQVNVGAQVNTPSTIANGELHASLAVRMSPMSEFVIINVVKVAITQSLV